MGNELFYRQLSLPITWRHFNNKLCNLTTQHLFQGITDDLVMITNDNSEAERMPLTLRVSFDNGKTWPHVRNIVNKPGDTAAYPFIIETADGSIHGVYTSEERSVVNHFVMEESEVNQPAE